MRKFLIGFGLIGALVLSACGDDSSETTNDNKSYSEAVDYTITGIEPGAGISVTTEKAIEEYDSLSGWTVELSSTAAMASELDKAIENEEPIIITGWNPHWTFAKHPDMKYLEDPKGIYGGEEEIRTIVRKGLEEEKPEAYKVLEQFSWDVEDMEGIMYESKETGDDIDVVAQRWVEDNQDKVDTWLDGVNEVDGVKVELVSTPWDSERASANVVKFAMEQKGFDVTVTPVDVAVVFESIANGDGDASLAPWMPITHKEFYEGYQDEFIDLGANLIGAKIGLVVPAYMDIDSIEDLEPK
ncbi:glycine betaine ABC transporter substrate-binding protein [Ornithinibacillus halotolerans]|uniref:Glycine/betaine ABC transporter substrate-binding protein n=1 Tax=Ornithinibacillus halotolerans TaxID=1274357 RepID=A0A916RZ70_9BACI|nr:glycine betaine ABC transporter substrate-binding protein [Ornithinibacillus halotolerans]GGA73500.1 glycine/betaine ABC transporter substrate-binding protein [Ornithinibacillus halotolerans]